MDANRRQELGWGLLAALVLAFGLIAQLFDANTAKVLGGVLIWAGGLVLVWLVAKNALRLIRG